MTHAVTNLTYTAQNTRAPKPWPSIKQHLTAVLFLRVHLYSPRKDHREERAESTRGWAGQGQDRDTGFAVEGLSFVRADDGGPRTPPDFESGLCSVCHTGLSQEHPRFQQRDFI